MKNVLDKFCFSLVQKVSFIMFRVVSLPKWILPIQEEICKILDIKETMDIRSFLDFPIYAKAIRAKYYDEIVEGCLKVDWLES